MRSSGATSCGIAQLPTSNGYYGAFGRYYVSMGDRAYSANRESYGSVAWIHLVVTDNGGQRDLGIDLASY